MLGATDIINVASGVQAVNAANASVSYAISSTFDPVAGSTLSVTPSTQFAAVGAKRGYSANELSMSGHLDAGFAANMTPAMARVYGRLAGQDDAHVQSSMDALGNEAVQSVGAARMAASQDFVDRMNSCPQFGPGGMQLAEQNCLWSRATDNHAHRDGSSTGVGYETGANKYQIGGQRGVGDGWFLGGSIGYDQSSLSAPLTTVSGTGWTAALIAKKQIGDWLFSGAVDVSTGSYDSRRQVTLNDAPETVSASFNASGIGLHARVAHQFAMDGGWYFKPYVDVHAVRLHTGAYNETGANELNLLVNSSNGTALTVSPMLEAGSLFDLGHGMELRGYVSGGVSVSNQNDWSANATLQGSVARAGKFTTASELPNQRFKLNVGADLIANKNLDIRLEYTGEFASGFRSNGAMLKAAFAF
ncbi:autotransporter outer membrane beta-barrel domain-containing protein [Variovorax rhizosphaerae]|uniref:Autotransporter outer membrane beta-barrel domain-containing protein n=1 Tax=Variovorax rhizosphaerae TaxID=1836200 RepID=A0ABU8WWJ5_9BURK